MAALVKHVCSDRKCEGRPTYLINGTCRNCRSPFVGEFTVGHEAHRNAVACPICGVRNTSWGAAVGLGDPAEEIARLKEAVRSRDRRIANQRATIDELERRCPYRAGLEEVLQDVLMADPTSTADPSAWWDSAVQKLRRLIERP